MNTMPIYYSDPNAYGSSSLSSSSPQYYFSNTDGDNNNSTTNPNINNRDDDEIELDERELDLVNEKNPLVSLLSSTDNEQQPNNKTEQNTSANISEAIQKTRDILIKSINYYSAFGGLKSLKQSEFLKGTLVLDLTGSPHQQNHQNGLYHYPNILHVIPLGHPLIIFISDLNIFPYISLLPNSPIMTMKNREGEEEEKIPLCDQILSQVDGSYLHCYNDEMVNKGLESMIKFFTIYGFSVKFQTITFPNYLKKEQNTTTSSSSSSLNEVKIIKGNKLKTKESDKKQD